MALLPAGRTPGRRTTWTAAELANGEVTVLLVGPEATPLTGSIVVPVPGGDLWARITDAPEVDAALIESIRVL